MTAATATTLYNGWANRATWNVALWLGNDEYTYREAVDYAKRHPNLTAGRARYFVTVVLGWDRTPDGLRMGRVKWSEIADCIKEMAGE